MKKQVVASILTFIIITLFAFSISEAVTFRFTEVPDSPPPHMVGETFTVNFVIDCADLSAGTKITGVTIVATYTDSKIAPKNPAAPFTMGSYLSGFMVLINKLEGNKLTFGATSFTSVDIADNQIMASVEFQQVTEGIVPIVYDQSNSKYTKLGIPGSFKPDVFGTKDLSLPVELSVFTAIPTDRGVSIQWRTESEINNLGFDIYRSESPDGKFVKVNPAYIKGAGTDATPHDYQFVDESAVVGKTYYYYLETISFSGERERSHIIKVIIDISGKVKVTGLMQPTTFALLQNFPNPFNPETWIPFRLAKDADVTIRVFNLRGQEVRTIHLGQMPAGYYDTRGKAVLWDGRDSYGQEVSSGIYFYNLTAGSFSATKKLTIIK